MITRHLIMCLSLCVRCLKKWKSLFLLQHLPSGWDSPQTCADDSALWPLPFWDSVQSDFSRGRDLFFFFSLVSYKQFRDYLWRQVLCLAIAFIIHKEWLPSTSSDVIIVLEFCLRAECGRFKRLGCHTSREVLEHTISSFTTFPLLLQRS